MALATRIAAVSVAAPELQQIRQAFESIRSQLPGMWLWTTDPEADVVLIDVDSVHGHMDWLRMQRSDRTLISLTQRPARHDDLVLMKPVTSAGLLATLKRAGEVRGGRADPGERASEESVQDAAPVAEEPLSATPEPAPAPQRAVPSVPVVETPASPPGVEAAAPVPAGAEPSSDALSLVEYLSPALLPRPSRAAIGDAPALTIDPENDCYYGPSTLKPLLAYCASPIPRSAWEPVSPAVLQGLRAAGGGQPLSRLVWLQALASSNGQLLPGMDLNARYRLVRWPLIEREYPRHFRIATIMMKGPATLTEIADQSGAALADVIEFVNAYSVTGFVEPDGAAAAANDGPASGSLLSRLRARARRG